MIAIDSSLDCEAEVLYSIKITNVGQLPEQAKSVLTSINDERPFLSIMNFTPQSLASSQAVIAKRQSSITFCSRNLNKITMKVKIDCGYGDTFLTTLAYSFDGRNRGGRRGKGKGGKGRNSKKNIKTNKGKGKGSRKNAKSEDTSKDSRKGKGKGKKRGTIKNAEGKSKQAGFAKKGKGKKNKGKRQEYN